MEIEDFLCWCWFLERYLFLGSNGLVILFRSLIFEGLFLLDLLWFEVGKQFVFEYCLYIFARGKWGEVEINYVLEYEYIL